MTNKEIEKTINGLIDTIDFKQELITHNKFEEVFRDQNKELRQSIIGYHSDRQSLQQTIHIQAEQIKELKTIKKPSEWVYFHNHLNPILIGAITAMIFNSTYSLIETIIIKIALIING